MGVEWNIGCLECKTHIWMGSQKPYKWHGFQIGTETLFGFLSLHTTLNCKLLLCNDRTADIPWEDESINDWKEDILSRSFWDSYSQEGIICGHCELLLAKEESECLNKGHLQKNDYLWFCNDSCIEGYLKFHETERDCLIYDSSSDTPTALLTASLEVGCQSCKSFTRIDHQLDKDGSLRDLEYLAYFLSEHVGQVHQLCFYSTLDKRIETPWKKVSDWEEYLY